jgi:hypothetical protein
MFVRITPVRFDASRQEAVEQVSRDLVIPLFQGLPGFRRYHGVVDRAQGTGAAISYWETQEQAEAAGAAVRPLLPQVQAASIELSPPAIYEVVVEG